MGVVQLGSWKNPPEGTRDEGALFPLIRCQRKAAQPCETIARWHQTLDYGYLPNPQDNNMFLAMALDTYRQVP